MSTAATGTTTSAPLSDTVIAAISRLVDDSQSETRQPSHSDLEFHVGACGLSAADPNNDATRPPVGKAKRVREILSWSLENAPDGGEALVAKLIAHLKGIGGFRVGAANYVGSDAISGAIEAFRAEGFDLGVDGDLRPTVLEGLSGRPMTEALYAYVRRAQRGVTDAALLAGTGKDLLEAVARHVLHERRGAYPTHTNFPTLLGIAFAEVGLATSVSDPSAGESATGQFERCLYDLGCAVNRLRNAEGTGHGRPFLPSLSTEEGQEAVQAMGLVANALLRALDR